MDYLIFFDGMNDQSTEIARLSGNLGGFSFTSHKSSLYVKLITKSSFTYNGFFATIQYGNYKQQNTPTNSKE